MIRRGDGFTLIELIVVVMILSVLVGIALPNYSKSVRKAREQDALIQLRALYMANKNYFYQENKFLDTGGSTRDKSFVNTGLGINLMGSGVVYTYASSSATTYNAYATWDDPDNSVDFTIRINQAALSASNPCCSAGVCPTLGAC